MTLLFTLGVALRVKIQESPLGHVTAVISIYSGEEYGWVNSEKVKILDNASKRTQQRTNISEDIEGMARDGSLRDENGKKYSIDEIREVALVFQVPSVNSRETTLTYVTFPFGPFAEFSWGTVKQLAGQPVTVNLPVN